MIGTVSVGAHEAAVLQLLKSVSHARLPKIMGTG